MQQPLHHRYHLLTFVAIILKWQLEVSAYASPEVLQSNPFSSKTSLLPVETVPITTNLTLRDILDETL